MKKTFLFILTILLIIVCVAIGLVLKNQNKQKAIVKQNKQYEYYLNKEVKGADVATLINKVIDHNENNNIQKDEKGYYIENRHKQYKNIFKYGNNKKNIFYGSNI